MHEEFTRLVSALQSELQEYGRLLQLFDQQQACILRHDPLGFLDINPAVEEQIASLTERRITREALVRETAVHLGYPEEVTLTALTADFPPPRQPLLRALIEEINNLIARTQRRTQQNRMLLAQCVDLARQLVINLNPEALPGTYSAHGEISSSLTKDRFTTAVA